MAAHASRAGCPVIDDVANSPTCTSRRFTVAVTIETFAVYVKRGLTELGPPPIEIASLVVRTADATDAMAAADSAYRKVCVNGGAGPSDELACEKASGGWSTAERGVVSMINAWAPYTH
jgi:hypothetical protein